MKKLPITYFIMPNGMKIDTRCDFGSLYAMDQMRTEFAKAFQVPKDFLFPDEKLVDVTIKEPRINVALTEELRRKGSFTVTFNFVNVKDV